MKFPTIIIFTPGFILLQAFSAAAQGIGGGAVIADTTTNKKPEPTTVWVTSTLPGGAPTVVASLYTQEYQKNYETIAVPSSGSIGLGTQTGKIGIVRETQATGAGMRGMGVWGEGDAWMLGAAVGVVGMVAGGVLVL